MGCEKILGIKAELSPEAVIISVPFAPEAEAKVSVNIFFDNSFLFFFFNKKSIKLLFSSSCQYLQFAALITIISTPHVTGIRLTVLKVNN